MPRSPLLPLLRTGAFLALGAFLLWPSRAKSPKPPVATGEAPPIAYTVTLGQQGGPPPVDVPVPAKPFPGQVTTCRPKVHTLINGGCWRKLADTPPCEESYLWRGACYVPDMLAQRPTTSIQGSPP